MAQAAEEQPILEIALLDVRPGERRAFETAFSEARLIISSMPGFLNLELRRSADREHRYALLVNWRRLEDHTVGFRQSPQYAQWRKLLHRFYDPFPSVEHFATPIIAERIE